MGVAGQFDVHGSDAVLVGPIGEAAGNRAAPTVCVSPACSLQSNGFGAGNHPTTGTSPLSVLLPFGVWLKPFA